jgi:hypothetical protein
MTFSYICMAEVTARENRMNEILDSLNDDGTASVV